MSKKFPSGLLIPTILSMFSNDPSMSDIIPYRNKSSEPKNKYKLTDEEIELMENMTPKEKKKFLKGKNGK